MKLNKLVNRIKLIEMKEFGLKGTLAIVGTVLTAVIIFYFFLGLILGFTA